MKLISMGYVVFDNDPYDEIHFGVFRTMDAARKCRAAIHWPGPVIIKEIFEGMPVNKVHPAGAYVSP